YPTGGNLALTPMTSAMKSGHQTVRILVTFYLFLFLLMVPLLAWYEEKLFRKGKETFRALIAWSFIFGFAHLIMGIPLALAPALTVAGFFYGVKYQRRFRGALRKRGITSYSRVGRTWLIDSDCLDPKEVVTAVDCAREDALLHSATYHALFNSLVVGYLLFRALKAI
ncbi:MAG: hypothetical protein ABIH41_05465, partial [Nanoarchaeota archaeon]